MQLERNNLPYYDGRDLDKLAKRIQESKKTTNTVVVGPKIPEGTVLHTRYPHPFEQQN